MRIERHEIVLIVGLIAAIAVAFSGQTAKFVETARQFEGAHSLGLLPGLGIATLTLLVFLQGARRDRDQPGAARPGPGPRARAARHLLAGPDAVVRPRRHPRCHRALPPGA